MRQYGPAATGLLRLISAQGYSYLSASIGSRRAAFTAGHIPKIKPTAHDTKNPSNTAHKGITEGSVGASCLRARLTTQPANMPINPPTAVNVIASVKNCQM